MSKTDETRLRILESARQLLETSTAPVSMGQIAATAGVTRQLLYFHFEGRADLLLQLSRAVDAEARTPSLQQRIDEAPDATMALGEMVAVQGEIKPRINGIASAIDRLRATDTSAAAAWEERESARLRRVSEVIERLANEHRLAPDWTVEAASRMAWSATSQRAWNELVIEAGWTTREWVRHTTTLLVRGLSSCDSA